VRIGNGVILRYSDGTQGRLVLEGYIFSDQLPQKNIDMVSIYGPIGKALLGLKVGEQEEVRIRERVIRFSVEQIFPPSRAENLAEVEG